MAGATTADSTTWLRGLIWDNAISYIGGISVSRSPGKVGKVEKKSRSVSNSKGCFVRLEDQGSLGLIRALSGSVPTALRRPEDSPPYRDWLLFGTTHLQNCPIGRSNVLSGHRTRFRSRIQLARLGFPGKLKADFDGKVDSGIQRQYTKLGMADFSVANR